jgi:hypothetical protein
MFPLRTRHVDSSSFFVTNWPTFDVGYTSRTVESGHDVNAWARCRCRENETHFLAAARIASFDAWYSWTSRRTWSNVGNHAFWGRRERPRNKSRSMYDIRSSDLLNLGPQGGAAGRYISCWDDLPLLGREAREIFTRYLLISGKENNHIISFSIL